MGLVLATIQSIDVQYSSSTRIHGVCARIHGRLSAPSGGCYGSVKTLSVCTGHIWHCCALVVHTREQVNITTAGQELIRQSMTYHLFYEVGRARQ
jgi:hypothetical protein